MKCVYIAGMRKGSCLEEEVLTLSRCSSFGVGNSSRLVQQLNWVRLHKCVSSHYSTHCLDPGRLNKNIMDLNIIKKREQNGCGVLFVHQVPWKVWKPYLVVLQSCDSTFL